MPELIDSRRVCFQPYETGAFMETWPRSRLIRRRLEFEFASNGDLIDHNLTDAEDGEAASALADDAKTWLFQKIVPAWLEG